MHSTRKKIYVEKFPAGHCELKTSCNRPIAWSDGFSCTATRIILLAEEDTSQLKRLSSKS